MTSIELTLNTQQIRLIDAHVDALALPDRDALVSRALAEFPPVHLLPRQPTAAAKRNRRVVAEHIIEPGTGKGVVVRGGQILRVEQITGGQCADFNVFNLDNKHEHLHLGRTRSLHGNSPRPGDLVWSRAPWERPLLAILEDTGQTDSLVPYCSALLYWRLFGQREHTNCQQIQIEAQREWGLPPYAVHESLNLFMYVEFGDDELPVGGSNRAGPDDFIEFFAFMDVLAVVNVCGDDMGATNNFELSSLRVLVLEGKDEDRQLGESFQYEDHPTGLLPQPYRIPAARLKADASYEPHFPHAPVVQHRIRIELSETDKGRLQSLAKHELYGDDLAASLRDLTLRWVTGQPRVEQ